MVHNIICYINNICQRQWLMNSKTDNLFWAYTPTYIQPNLVNFLTLINSILFSGVFLTILIYYTKVSFLIFKSSCNYIQLIAVLTTLAKLQIWYAVFLIKAFTNADEQTNLVYLSGHLKIFRILYHSWTFFSNNRNVNKPFESHKVGPSGMKESFR